mmetsp:Transcript_26816/g.61797  ORF Transcript_26816/g.61797 Transcript_26816/m.61797 type:complete len:485 (-) Transcript_26816:31-1485(-)
MRPPTAQQLSALVLLLLGLAASAISPLTKRGRWLLDNNERVVTIHGVNQVNKRPPYDARSVGFDSRSARLLQQMGINGVRLGVMWCAVEPSAGSYNDTYLDSLAVTIDSLAQHDIHTLLDMHQDAYSTLHGGAGFPEWAALGTGPPNTVGFPAVLFGGNETHITPVVDNDYDAFWNNVNGVQDRFVGAVTRVAERLGSLDGVIGLELMNEPFAGSGWVLCGNLSSRDFSRGCEVFDSGLYTAFVQRAARSVHASAPSLLVWYDANLLFGLGAPSFVGHVDDPLLGFSYHNYNVANFSTPFENALAHQSVNDAALLCSEFGANPAPSKWDEVLDLAESQFLSWMYWAYTNDPPYNFSDTNSSLPPDPRAQGIVRNASEPLTPPNLNAAVARTLTRPYFRSLAGIPLAAQFSMTNRSFMFTYLPSASPVRESVVFVPESLYPGGSYVATADGANVTVVSGKEELLVASDPGREDPVHFFLFPRSVD